MATKFPKFSQALAQDPATRRIWFGLATAHDFESHDGMTEKSLPKDLRFSLWTPSCYFPVDFWKLIPCCLARELRTVGIKSIKSKTNCTRNLGPSLWSIGYQGLY